MYLPGRRAAGLLLLAVFIGIFTAGCGETLRGIGRDVNRMGRGVKTIFLSDK